MSESYDLGKYGENKAVDFLLSKGFSILETNWRYNHKEIDIIAEHENKLHIVEVKIRSSDYWQTSTEVVDAAKQKNLIEAAEAYIEQNNIDKCVVFDIVYILQNKNQECLELIQDAFSSYE